MLIRTQTSLYNTDKARYFWVYEIKYGKFEASLEIVWGWLDDEGSPASASIFSGTGPECQAMMDRIASAIVQDEIKIFNIKDDGTKRKEVEPEPLPKIEDKVEIPF